MTANNRAVLFGGQGTQYPGMGRRLYEADPACRRIFEIGSHLCSIDLATVCFHGTQEMLNQTQYTQPAVLAVDLCAYVLACRAGHTFGAAAGFSLGEYAALVAAGVVTVEEAFRLVAWRTACMLATVPERPCGMAAVVSLTVEQAQQLCDRIDVGTVFVTNHNAVDQLSVAGDRPGLDAFAQSARQQGATVIPLKVNRPFHCAWMKPAAHEFDQKLRDMPLRRPVIPLYMNATGWPADDPETIRKLLVQQIYKPVLWWETLENLWASGSTVFWECAPKSISGRLLQSTLSGRAYTYRWYSGDDQ